MRIMQRHAHAGWNEFNEFIEMYMPHWLQLKARTMRLVVVVVEVLAAGSFRSAFSEARFIRLRVTRGPHRPDQLANLAVLRHPAPLC